jgi:alkyl hydroperoxide reductase subunit AhpC
LSQLRQQKERVERLGIEVLVVSFEDEEHALNYQKETALEWPMVVDKQLELYSYYGLTRAGFRDLWGFATWKVYLREILKGNLPKSAKGDVHQRGGDVLIDPQGIVRLHLIGKGPADRPAIDEVLRIVEKKRATEMSPEELRRLKN